MANELSDCMIVALDISQDALSVARKNAADLGAIGRIEFLHSDFFSSLKEGQMFDLILSNPPYIPESEYGGLPPEVLADPKMALTAGTDGLDAIRAIVREAPLYLAEGGRIIFEIGHDQADRVAELTAGDERYQSLVIIKDLNGLDRIAMLSCG